MKIPIANPTPGKLYRMQSTWPMKGVLCELRLSAEGIILDCVPLKEPPQSHVMFLEKQIVHIKNDDGSDSVNSAARCLIGEKIVFLASRYIFWRDRGSLPRCASYEMPEFREWVTNEH